MMASLSKCVFPAILLCGLVMPINTLTAGECYEKSPNLLKLGDKYYDLDDTHTLSEQDQEMLDNLYENIKGDDWKGRATITDCKGPDRAPVKSAKNVNLVADINSFSNNSLKISADLYFPEEKVTRHRTLKLLHDWPLFDFSFISNSELTFSERLRFRNANSVQNTNRGSRLVENIYTIKYIDDLVTLTITHYTNGVFSGEEVWSLSR